MLSPVQIFWIGREVGVTAYCCILLRRRTLCVLGPGRDCNESEWVLWRMHALPRTALALAASHGLGDLGHRLHTR